MNSERKSNFESILKSDKLFFPNTDELHRGALCAAVAFSLGICPLPFSTRPLGLAFLCSADKATPFAVLGMILASLLVPASKTAYLLSTLLALVLRVLTRLFIDTPQSNTNSGNGIGKHDIFGEALSLRAASAAVSAFALSLYFVVKGDFSYYDLFGAIFAVLSATASTILFHGAFIKNEDRTRVEKLHQKAANIAISSALCLSLCTLPLKGFNAGLAAAFVFTNLFCLKYGLIEGCISAVLCGTLCGTQNIIPLLIAAFAAYCLLDFSPTLGAAVSCLACAACGAFLIGAEYLPSRFLSLLSGCAFYSAVRRISDIKSERVPICSPDIGNEARTSILRSRLEAAEKSLRDSTVTSASPLFCAELIKTISDESSKARKENEKLSCLIAEALPRLGFGRCEVSVIGERQCEIYIRCERIKHQPSRLDLLRQGLSQAVSMPLTRPKLIERTGKSALHLRQELSVSYRSAVSLSAREQICGDCALVFEDTERGYLYALICDGMGSGEDANAISSMASEKLKLMLLCGFPPRKALMRLSEELCEQAGNRECTTTADLLTIDLYTGQASLFKCGAAPSYLIRNGDAVRLSARTVPMGIIRRTDMREIDFELQDGDLLFMASDGVSESENDCLPLIDYLSSGNQKNPSVITEDVIELSRRFHREDDLSVIAIKISLQNK